MEQIKKPIQKDILKMTKLLMKLQSEKKIIKEITKIQKTSDYNFKVFFTDGTNYHIASYFKKQIELDRRLFLTYQQITKEKI